MTSSQPPRGVIALATTFFIISTFTYGIDVGGHVDKDTAWTGDIHMVDDVTVSPGVTLHIDNAKIQAATHTRLRIQGRLLASHSTFIADDKWAGITIEPQTFAFSPPHQSRSKIENCTFAHAQTAIRIIGHNLLDPPTITNCTIRYGEWGGIVIDSVDGATIEKNTIENIAVSRPSDQGRPLALMNCADAKVCDNVIRNSSDAGIFLAHCRDAEIRGNRTEHIIGGPGPGLGGYYKRWGFGALLQACDRCKIVGNQFTDSAYDAVCLSYGCNDNLVESNRCETCLDSLNVLGEGKNNLLRNNLVIGGWTILYITGSGPTTYEKCDTPPTGGGGGACFTVRTGDTVYKDCTWNALGMNIWGGRVRVERCKLKTQSGPSVSLKNAAVGTLVDCDFNQDAMACDSTATGHVDVAHHLTLTVVDGNKPISAARVTATEANGNALSTQTDSSGAATLDLPQFTFSAKGKQKRGPWTIAVEHEAYEKSSFQSSATKPDDRHIDLKPAR